MKVTNESIRLQLIELGLLSPQLQIGDTESLMDAGVLDSLRLTDLVTELERTFGINVELDDLVPDNFDTIDDITRFVAGKRSAAQEGIASAGK